MSRYRSVAGQSLVEFALVLPIFLLLVFGVIDGGRLIYTYNSLSNAARDGARVAIVNQSTSGSATCDTTQPTAWPSGCAVAAGIGLGLTEADVQVEYRDSTDTTPCATPQIGCLVVVKVTGTYQPLTPVLSQLIGTITLDSTTKMAIERVCTNPTSPPIPHC